MYDEIINYEKDLLSSTIRGDKESVERLMAEEFREIGMSGMKFNKKDILDSLESWDYLEYEGVEFEYEKLREGLIILFYKALVKNNKDNTKIWTRRSSIWEKKEDGWKMVFHQGTKIG